MDWKTFLFLNSIFILLSILFRSSPKPIIPTQTYPLSNSRQLEAKTQNPMPFKEEIDQEFQKTQNIIVPCTATNIEVYREQMDVTMKKIQAQNILQSLMGNKFRLNAILQERSYTSYIFSFDMYVLFLVFMVMFQIATIVITFLCLKPNFPSEKYRRNLDKNPYNRVEMIFPAKMNITLSTVLVIFCFITLDYVDKLQIDYELTKCTALELSKHFQNGYSEAQQTKYKNVWKGNLNYLQYLENYRKDLLANEDLMKTTFAETDEWLDFYLYNVVAAIDICYFRVADVYIYDQDPTKPLSLTYQPDLIINLGSKRRIDSSFYKLYKQYNETYAAFAKEIKIMKNNSEHIGNNFIDINNFIKDKQFDVKNVTLFYNQQEQNLRYFMVQTDTIKTQFTIIYRFILGMIIAFCFLDSLMTCIVYIIKLTKFRVVLHFSWQILQFLQLMSIFIVAFTGYMVYAANELCVLQTDMFKLQEAFNKSKLFYNPVLQNRLESCWYQKEGNYYQNINFTSSLDQVQEINNALVNLQKIKLMDVKDMESTHLYNELNKQYKEVETMYPTRTDQKDLRSARLYLNSLTDKNTKYIKDNVEHQIQTEIGSTDTTYDVYVFDGRTDSSNTQCPQGYTVYNLTNDASNPLQHKGNKNCFVIFDSQCTDFEGFFTNRYPTIDSSGSVSSLLDTGMFSTNEKKPAKTLKEISKYLCDIYGTVKYGLKEFVERTNFINIQIQNLDTKIKQLSDTVLVDKDPKFSFNTQMQTPINDVINQDYGIIHVVNCKYLKYAFVEFQQHFCNELYVKMANIFFYLIFLQILVYFFAINNFNTANRIMFKSKMDLMNQKMKVNQYTNRLDEVDQV